MAIRVEKIAAYQAQKTASELLGLDILPPVEDSQYGHHVGVDAEVDAALAVGERPESGAYPLSGYPGESGPGYPFDFGAEIGHEFGGDADIFAGEI